MFLVNLKILTKSNANSFIIVESILNSCVTGLINYKFQLKLCIIQSYIFINKINFIIDLNKFVYIYLLKYEYSNLRVNFQIYKY